MTRPRAYLELFAGGAACALALLGGASVVPPVGYMGGKRKLASVILGAAGLHIGQGAERLLLVDAGEWGGVWQEILRDGRGLADRMLAWVGCDPSDLWRDLAAAGRPDDPQERAAAYLWLQGRAASCTPVWWQAGLPDPPRGVARQATARGERLVMADKPGRPAQRAQEKGRCSVGSGIMRPSTVAHRIIKAHAALSVVDVLVRRSHPTADEVATWLETPGDLRGVVVVLDPPYVGATRYEATCSRAEVVTLADDYRRLGAMVFVCEAEAIPELLATGWHALDLRDATGKGGKPEWLTCSDPPHQAHRRQISIPFQPSGRRLHGLHVPG